MEGDDAERVPDGQKSSRSFGDAAFGGEGEALRVVARMRVHAECVCLVCRVQSSSGSFS